MRFRIFIGFAYYSIKLFEELNLLLDNNQNYLYRKKLG